MRAHSPHPTPYPDANAMLRALLLNVRSILGDRFLGMYLSGSLAMGDFDESSDIDVLVVTTDALPNEMFAALWVMHERFSADDSKWGAELEVSYIPWYAVRRYDPARDLHPHIARGERLRREEHRQEWDIQRHIIRERGIVVEGPEPRILIDPVGPDDLRRAVLAALREWWPRPLRDPVELHPRGYRSYFVLTGCRMLYTLRYGIVGSKPVAARWAALIAWALAARRDPRSGELDNLTEALDFIRYVIERSRQFELPTDVTQGSSTG